LAFLILAGTIPKWRRNTMIRDDLNVLESDEKSLITALEWQAEMGADDAVFAEPFDRYAHQAAKTAARTASAAETQTPAPSPPPAPRAAPTADAPLGTAEAVSEGKALAAGCSSLEDLRAALEKFDGCQLKFDAKNLVFGDGNPSADIMVIGEAPGRDEDIQGLPFVGVSGQLLDRMLSYIGLTRETFYITNTVYWRPAGNRTPNDGEFAVCRPFVEKHIELVDPKLLLLVGGRAVTSLAGVTQGITKSRGKWYDVTVGDRTLPAMATFHPAYLLRNGPAKRFAWRDLLALQRRMREEGIGL